MKVSTKGRYALAAVTHMAQQHSTGEYITVLSIAERLGISKIYLEQVFSLLKRGGIVNSTKGAQGGYRLARSPGEISALDVLEAVELSLFEEVQETVGGKAPDIELALQRCVFESLDTAARAAMGAATIERIVSEAERYRQTNEIMFYI